MIGYIIENKDINRFIDTISISIGCFDGESDDKYFQFEWYNNICNWGNLRIRLVAYNDSWELLLRCSDIFDELKNYEKIDLTQEQIIEILNKLGYNDLTTY